MALLREYAEDIEGDLLFRGIDIFDWYRGKVSDRRMLVLLKKLPEDSAFKTAFRKGWPLPQTTRMTAEAWDEFVAFLDWDWPLRDELIGGLWNEVKALRTLAFHDPYKPILSPSAQRERDAKRQTMRAAHDDVMAQLRG